MSREKFWYAVVIGHPASRLAFDGRAIIVLGSKIEELRDPGIGCRCEFTDGKSGPLIAGWKPLSQS
ncbi:MAG: hypothetical protein JRJ09_03905 [Deltaproteobacteria bacterium]|nr:hypothetical protein [Deltaproteobacteria bacterium]MBW2047656.1 hypothetical protein [Deltaproteobacteria bacterium]MBW2110683.1 hypothetical protein [Deltaproteobacteria bacterium]MBW2351777.1 hypothetical protein [Deltaproteobacteria bacterium]HDZ90141.1 hypothetical protein [Deltaproteobacteria bacterium]